MHCENFSNINGIQIWLFQNLVELNLSSNNLEDIGELICMKQLRILNLSCNKISQIQGLDNSLHSLEKIILSHNRIAHLNYFGRIQNSSEAPNLSHLDLNDNYIGDIQQL